MCVTGRRNRFHSLMEVGRDQWAGDAAAAAGGDTLCHEVWWLMSLDSGATQPASKSCPAAGELCNLRQAI